EAGGATDQRSAREGQRRDRLQTARGHGAGAIGDAAGALEEPGDRGMRLEALELVEGRERGVGVVEMGDEAEINLVVAGVVAETAAGGGEAERVAEIVVDAAGPVFFGRDLPDFLDAEAIFLRALASEAESRSQL